MARWTTLGKERTKKGEQRVWLVRQADGSEVAHPAHPSSGDRRGPGAVRKPRKRELERDLAKARRAGISRATSGGGFEPRSSDGQRVEKLDVKPSASVESGEAVICDPPLGGSRQVEKGNERRVSYRNIIEQPTTVDGRVLKNDAGGDVLARDVGRL